MATARKTTKRKTTKRKTTKRKTTKRKTSAKSRGLGKFVIRQRPEKKGKGKKK